MTAPLIAPSTTPTLPRPQFPPLTKQDVLACSFSSWYALFRRHSPKATVIKSLSASFVDYLESDGLFLPEGSGPMGISELSDSDSEAENSDTDSDSDDQARQHSFPALDAEIRAIIAKYDGAVFPKLNWSSPQDAAWMIPGQNLKCQTPADVYLLLKASDFVSHDLDHAFDGCDDREEGGPVGGAGLEALVERLKLETESADDDRHQDGASDETRDAARPFELELVLKKWFDMPKSQEWRCFVRDRRLIAISQRDNNFYEFLQTAAVLTDIKDKIQAFFEAEIRDTFPLSSYVFDVYLTRAGDRVFVVDFNPYAPHTDSLLVPWHTINELASDASPSVDLPIIQTVESAQAAAQSMPRFSHNRYPKDVVELSTGSSIAEFAKEWSANLEEGVKQTLTGDRESSEIKSEVEKDVAGR
ncbi:hypothetical protein ACM66B_006039 [Microbotryomycetes sp. NB124-2]